MDIQAINCAAGSGVLPWITPSKGNKSARDVNLRKLSDLSNVLVEIKHSKKLAASPLITKEIAGVGLGLLIVPRLIHAHGTDFTSDRETGASTTVTNRFPKERILMPA